MRRYWAAAATLALLASAGCSRTVEHPPNLAPTAAAPSVSAEPVAAGLDDLEQVRHPSFPTPTATSAPPASPPPPGAPTAPVVSAAPAPAPAPVKTPARAKPSTPRPAPAPAPAPAPEPPSSSPGCPTPARASIRSAPGGGRTVALTFDDGAAPDMVQIAQILAAHGAAATFFDTGAHDQASAGVVAQVASMGFLVEDHTWDHNYPSQTPDGWSMAYLRDQIARTAELQSQLTGRRPCFFRPPGGYQQNVLAAAAAEGMSVVMWSIDARDWAQPDHNDPAVVDDIVATATSSPGSHPIVLMHAGKASHEPESQVSSFRGNTVAALPRIIDWYAANGYRFVDLEGNSR